MKAKESASANVSPATVSKAVAIVASRRAERLFAANSAANDGLDIKNLTLLEADEA